MRSISLTTQELNLPLIWDKAHYIDAWHELRGYRRDATGALICFFAYEQKNHPYGWEVESARPGLAPGAGSAYDPEALRPKRMAPNEAPKAKAEENPFAAAMAEAGLMPKKAV